MPFAVNCRIVSSHGHEILLKMIQTDIFDVKSHLKAKYDPCRSRLVFEGLLYKMKNRHREIQGMSTSYMAKKDK